MPILLKLKICMEILKGGIAVVDMYIALIINKRRTIEQVPVGLRAEVLADLAAIGLDGYGNPIVTP